MIQLGRLEGFYWVATTQGYARAARAFPSPITQPGVYAQVRRLEQELGVALFRRTGKDRVVLTKEGEALFRYVAPFYEGLPRVVSSLRAGSFGGRLAVGASGLTLRHLLPQWMRRLQVRSPQLEVRLSEVHVADPSLLRSGELDLLVDHLPTVPADLETVTVAHARAFLVLPSNDPLATRARVGIGELGDRTFIAFGADRGLRQLQLEALAAHGVRPPRIVLADSSETILGFVAAGMGASLVPWLTEQGPRLAGVVCHRLTAPGSTFPVVAAWLSSPRPDPFVALALACAPQP